MPMKQRQLVSFLVLTTTNAFIISRIARRHRYESNRHSSFLDWESIAPSGRGVWKQIVADGSVNETNDKKLSPTYEISYVGSLVGEDWWTPTDVIDCWISELQGMQEYAAAMLALGVDGSKVLNSDTFTELFVQEKLGISGKVQCKKLIMASKRLQNVRDEFPIGTVFDASDNFVVDPGKQVIRGMRLALESMKVGEKAYVVCRSDFAYGSQGVRKKNGNVLVPPFATLLFEITLLNAHLSKIHE